MFLTVLFILLIFYLLFLLFIFIGTFFNFFRITKKLEKFNSVSIIVAARNEENTISELLSALEAQDYPRKFYAVIAVSDRSTDNTDTIIKKYEKTNPHFHYIRINKERDDLIGKKNALTEGIKKAEGEVLLFTDADCIPGKNWIKSMNSKFNEGYDFVAGYSPLIAESKNWYEKIILFLKNLERLSIFTISAGSLGWNWGVTATARNMGYSKKLFEDINGFCGIGHIASGDDDLFLQKVSRARNFKLGFNYDPDSFVTSHEDEFQKFQIDQEKRRASKWKFYPINTKLFTAVIFCFYFLLSIAFIASVIGFFAWSDFLYIFIPKIIIDFVIVLQGAIIFKSMKYLTLFPLAEIFYIPYFLLFGILGTFSKYRWKSEI